MKNNQPNESLIDETYDDEQYLRREEVRQEVEGEGEEAHNWKQIGEKLYLCEHCDMEIEAAE
jgi:hypothetical protein